MKGSKPRPVIDHNAKAPEPPAHLSPAARAQWDYYTALLSAKRILSGEDLAALVILSTSMALYEKAQAALDRDGEVVDGQRSPWCTLQNQAWDRIRPLLSEFALSPTARARLKVEPQDDGGEFF